MLMCYKILNHFVDIPKDDVFTISNVKITRRNSFKLIAPNSRVDARADFFSVRIINIWNRLADEIINASNISSFCYKLVKNRFIFYYNWKTTVFYNMLPVSVNICCDYV